MKRHARMTILLGLLMAGVLAACTAPAAGGEDKARKIAVDETPQADAPPITEAAGADEAPAMTERWASAGRLVVLYAGPGPADNRICPLLRGRDQQPFCRRFAAAMLTACGDRDSLQIVLANGDIHRVNAALVGLDAGFDPAFHPAAPLRLQAAWIPEGGCAPQDRPARVIALDHHGALLLFDGSDWKPLRAKGLGA